MYNCFLPKLFSISKADNEILPPALQILNDSTFSFSNLFLLLSELKIEYYFISFPILA